MSEAEDPVRKYRCEACGAIGWTALSRGCRTCDSTSLVLFREPCHYAQFHRLLHDFSLAIAKLRSGAETSEQLVLATTYADRFRRTIIFEWDDLHSDFLDALSKIVHHYCEGLASPQDTLDSFSDLMGRTVENSVAASRLIGEALTEWLESQGERAAGIRKAKSVTMVCRESELLPLLLEREIQSSTSLGVFSFYVDEGVERFIAKSGGKAELICAAQPGRSYAFLPYNYHLNLTETAFRLLKDSVKLVPLIVALCHMKLPGEAVAIAETVKELLYNLTKLNEETGEVCLYEAIVTFRKRTKQYPTTQQLLEELHAPTVRREKCRFFDGTQARCVIAEEDVNRIVDYLRGKKVVKKVSADAWWVQM